MQKDNENHREITGLVPQHIVARCSEDNGNLEKALRARMSFDVADPDRRGDHTDNGAGGCDEADLFAAKAKAHVKEVHKRQDKSPSAL